ncbi:hypothetical protein [Cytobacillus purgationiresistens]|uniref:Fur-regulated basic protein FbpA n=1 Tax=Cytobacillus purgationiresistens TaxID=863449 RepID=A0ABU0AEP3_9BACI|nr:hypothetical protein [Cytobacillus purgationiresistens]MDQ0268908.1 hypothetical protein [Cytobacillus purgationiresistens]
MGRARLVNKAKLQQRLKYNFVLEKLEKLGVKESQQGVPLHKLSYEELKYELTLASFREIDVINDENRWF